MCYNIYVITNKKGDICKMASIKSEVILECNGAQYNEKDILAKVKSEWAAAGNLAKDIKSIKIYLKPEDMKAYYVINDDALTGSVEL